MSGFFLWSTTGALLVPQSIQFLIAGLLVPQKCLAMTSASADQTPQPGGNERIYFDTEASDLLVDLVRVTGLKKSNVVCALVRIVSGVSPRPGEERVCSLVKKAVGRESLMQFLDAVREVIGDRAKPVPCGKAGGVPEAWVFQSGVGVLAFFHPSEANVGEIFTKASKLKADYALSRMIVATTNGHSLSDTFLVGLRAAGVEIVALADLRTALDKA